MKIAVLSDIHSNIIALRECIAYLENLGCDEYIFLGDYISDTPYTRKTMDYLYAFSNRKECVFLRGNREDYMLDQKRIMENNDEQKKWGHNSGEGNLLFAYQQLTEKDFHFFNNSPIVYQYKKEKYPTILFCHGSPVSSREKLMVSGQNTKHWLETIEEKYLICAHTHIPCKLTCQGKQYYNCGSVGISIGDCGLAQCMVLEDCLSNGEAEWKAEFLKIPYDNEQVVKDICQSGLLNMAPWFVNSNIQILLTGVDYSFQLAALATKLSMEAGKQGQADEEYWAEAARQLGVPDYREVLLFV